MRLPSDASNESNRSGNNKVEAEARVRNVTIIFIDLSDVTPFAFYLELFVCDLSSHSAFATRKRDEASIIIYVVRISRCVRVFYAKKKTSS